MIFLTKRFLTSSPIYDIFCKNDVNNILCLLGIWMYWPLQTKCSVKMHKTIITLLSELGLILVTTKFFETWVFNCFIFMLFKFRFHGSSPARMARVNTSFFSTSYIDHLTIEMECCESFYDIMSNFHFVCVNLIFCWYFVHCTLFQKKIITAEIINGFTVFHMNNKHFFSFKKSCKRYWMSMTTIMVPS